MSPLIALAISEAPDVIAALKALFKKQNPALPEPTSAEVMAAYTQVFLSGLAFDDAWRAAHPKPPV